MKKDLKLVAVVFLGLIIWVGIVYLSAAFLKAEFNPFLWSEAARAVMLFVLFFYLIIAMIIVDFFNH